MQNGPQFIPSSMHQLTASSFSMAKCVHGARGVTGQTRRHVKASSVLEKKCHQQLHISIHFFEHLIIKLLFYSGCGGLTVT